MPLVWWHISWFVLEQVRCPLPSSLQPRRNLACPAPGAAAHSTGAGDRLVVQCALHSRGVNIHNIHRRRLLKWPTAFNGLVSKNFCGQVSQLQWQLMRLCIFKCHFKRASSKIRAGASSKIWVKIPRNFVDTFIASMSRAWHQHAGTIRYARGSPGHPRPCKQRWQQTTNKLIAFSTHQPPPPAKQGKISIQILCYARCNCALYAGFEGSMFWLLFVLIWLTHLNDSPITTHKPHCS